MMKLQVNAEVLDQWLRNHPNGLADLMKATRLSFWTIDRMRRGKYPNTPNLRTQEVMSKETGIDIGVLFKLAGSKRRAS